MIFFFFYNINIDFVLPFTNSLIKLLADAVQFSALHFFVVVVVVLLHQVYQAIVVKRCLNSTINYLLILTKTTWNKISQIYKKFKWNFNLWFFTIFICFISCFHFFLFSNIIIKIWVIQKTFTIPAFWWIFVKTFLNTQKKNNQFLVKT